ncbi:hypothetical protein WA158_003421 [Blastocystis sp. Blastoise]
MSHFLIGIKSSQVAISMNDEQPGQMLSLSSEKGKLNIESQEYNGSVFSTEKECWGILGVYSFVHRLYLAFVEEAKLVGNGAKGGAIYKIMKVNVIPIPCKDAIYVDEDNDCDKQLVEMIYTIYKIDNYYFSYTENITKKLQDQGPKIREFSHKYPDDVDTYFMFNSNVIESFKPLSSVLYDDLLLTVINGFIAIEPGCVIDGHSFRLIIISRRTIHNIGRRFNSRGIDENGDVANFVETEQILVTSSQEVYSYVQIRGSIPLKWTQTPTLKYDPKVNIIEDNNNVLFKTHMDMLKDRYTSVLCVNLIDKKKTQQRLGDAYERAILKSQNANIAFEWFDFHHECAKMKYQNLSKLVLKTIDFFMNNSYYGYTSEGRVINTQTGVIRTNCVDSLDRTNVVQSLYARRIIFLQLGLHDQLEDIIINSPFADFETIYKNIWADNANVLSREYSGTNAQKTDFTRTGKRTTRGAIDDLECSITRYYLNNFVDGYIIDCYKVTCGHYIPSLDVNCQQIMKTQSYSTFNKFAFGILVPIALISSIITYFSHSDCPITTTLGQFIIYFGTVAYVLIKKGTSFGRKFVNKSKFTINHTKKE